LSQRLPPLKSLQFFLVAARAGSFKQAAIALHVTQAAVSQQIRHLEQQLDMRLFIRSSQKTCLTEQGRRLLPFIEQGFESFETGIRLISGDNNPNILRISAINSFTSLWLLPRLSEFQSLHPELMVQLAPSNELVDFDQGEIDLAIRMGAGNYKGLAEKRLVNDTLIFIASPDLISEADAKNSQKVFSLPWIEDISADTQPIIQQACDKFNIDRGKLTASIRSNNSIVLIENALASRGFTLTNKSLVIDHLRTGRLIKLLDFSTISPYCLFLVAPEQHFSWPKIRKFEDWFIPKLTESFADLDQW
jgi:LysR family glycine cleavage system transcriptional activator